MMFYFTRNKAVTNVESASAPLANGAPATESQLEAILDEARKKLYESITLRRTDICISLINEWFKGKGKQQTFVSLLWGSTILLMTWFIHL